MYYVPDLQHNKTRDSRTKTVVLEVYDHATIATTWYIFLLTAILLSIITIAAATLICAITKRCVDCSIAFWIDKN